MLRTYPICLAPATCRPEGLRSIIRRLEAEIAQAPRTVQVTLPARPPLSARS
jgi:hypothetical protein